MVPGGFPLIVGMHRGASLHFKDPYFCGVHFERAALQARLAGGRPAL